MCGLIAAFESKANGIPRACLRPALTRMQRRGPDGEGIWHDHGVALGHRRLAILDLDTRAAQPMLSSCGRYAIVFNGEIYNFLALRQQLEAQGVQFRTTSDTEVLLSLFAREGAAMLPQLHGMFAFVIWDRQARRAFAARDPYGIKPLYFAEVSSGLILASQVKALLATGLVSRDPDPFGQAGFWMLGSVPEPRTWFQAIQALPAGSCAWIESGRVVKQYCWHDLGQAWRDAEHAPEISLEINETVSAALRESVARHLVADVPVGVFLSSGIDSGALAGLMVEIDGQTLEGITIAYDEFQGRSEDEAPFAAQIAKHYGIQHTVRRVTQQEFLADIPRIFAAMDQPSVDGVNTWYASKAVAERGLKVVVSGVGGDELFQGYTSFRTLPRLLTWRQLMRWIPGATALLTTAGHLQAHRTGNSRWRHLASWTRTVEGAWWLRRSTCAVEDLPALMGVELAQAPMRDLDPVTWVRAMTGPLPGDPMLAIGQIESMTYLRNQLLRDSDWASMDHSVELRTPLVDAYLLTQLQDLLPLFHKYPNKILVARAPRSPLFRRVMVRPKTGFSIPVAQWIGAPLARKRHGWTQQLVAAYASTA